jgi:DNA polymerase-3 subunit chi
MSEVLFYHLEGQPLERVLPQLLEKTIERGWQAVVETSSRERAEAIDALLWTYRDDSFLPHGTGRDAEAAVQPVVLTTQDGNLNAASVRFLIDGVGMPADAASYQRVVLIFDGEDEDALAAARTRWSEVKAQGFDTTYWQADEQGRWVKKG